MLGWLEQFLVHHPELALFLVIATGYGIGNFKLGSFSLGAVTGALFAGLIVGQFAHVPVSGMTKSFLFLLFMFGIGYSVGPQFLQTLRQDGLKPVLLALVVCATGLAGSILVAKALGLDPGYAAGLLSGALAQSAAIGTATDAVHTLPLPDMDRERLVAHIAAATAVCYVFGYAGVIIFSTVIAPALLRIDLRTEALKLEQALGMTRAKPALASAWRKFELRAYRISEGSPLVGSTIAEAEARAPEHRLFIHQLRRGESILEAKPDLTLQPGDVIALSGPRGVIVERVGSRAEETEDEELLDVPVTSAEVLLTSAKLAGMNLGEASRADWARLLYLRSLSRGRQEMPIAPGLVLQRGDLLRIVGPEPVVQKAASKIGTIVATGVNADFLVLGLAIFLGGVFGALVTFSVGDMRISLSTSVGTLLAGLVIGHLRTHYPLFGRIPDAAVAMMTSLGLAAFVGLIGMEAGPTFLSAVKQAGLSLLLGGMIVTLLPQVVGLIFGHFALRMNPILLIGALTGAQTLTAAMAAVQERSGSAVAVLGFTPAYPIASVLLTMWGAVMVLVMAH
jgi:putative transport protein